MHPNIEASVARLSRGYRLGAFLFCLGLGQASLAPQAIADGDSFIDGLAAYDGGDVAETVRIWQTLAETDDVNAQVGLAGLYLAGSGVRRDPEEAARLYRLAAEQGDSNGQLNLGRLYLDGVGVDRDPAAAYAWLTLAARQGRRWAEEQSLAIEPSLSDAERDKAEGMIANLTDR